MRFAVIGTLREAWFLIERINASSSQSLGLCCIDGPLADVHDESLRGLSYAPPAEQLPLVWMAIIGAGLVIAPLLSTFARLGQTRLVDLAWIGEVALYSTIGGYTLNLCIVALCFAAMWKLSDQSTLAND